SGAQLTSTSTSGSCLGITTIATDAAGNGFAAWKTFDNRLFVGKVIASGAPQWGATGILVSDAANNCSVTRATVVPDESGGCYLVWEDYRAGNPSTGPRDVYAQHITSAGTVAWAANGIAIAGGSPNQAWPAACTDGAGGFIVAWDDNRVGADYNTY